MGQKIVIQGGVDVRTKQYLSNKGRYSPINLGYGPVVRPYASALPLWEVRFRNLRKKTDTICRFADHMFIGRVPPESSADVKLILSDDVGVSADHAVICVREDQFIIEDLHSTNHTYVDGRRISSPCILQQGSIIEVGGTRLQVTLGRT